MIMGFMIFGPCRRSVFINIKDMPCSSTGAGSKRPEVLGRHENLGNLLEVLEWPASHCDDAILPWNGIMVYATFSALKPESEDQVRKLVNRIPSATHLRKTVAAGKIKYESFVNQTKSLCHCNIAAGRHGIVSWRITACVCLTLFYNQECIAWCHSKPCC